MTAIDEERYQRLDKRDQMLQDVGLDVPGQAAPDKSEAPNYRDELDGMMHAIISVDDSFFDELDEPVRRKMTALYLVTQLEEHNNDLAFEFATNHDNLYTLMYELMLYAGTDDEKHLKAAGHLVTSTLADYIPDKMQELMDVARREQDEERKEAAYEARRDLRESYLSD